MMPQLSSNADRGLIVALDGMDQDHAISRAGELRETGCSFKVNDLMTALGVGAVSMLSPFGPVMADPKWYDVKNTMKNHMLKIAPTKPKFVTVHACNTMDALEAAQRVAKLNGICLLGVTVLTTYDTDECRSVFGKTPRTKVREFALRALSIGIQGIVCSAKEAKMLRGIPGMQDVILITPGIRPKWATNPDEQKRVTTPAQAIRNGANMVVVGRPVNNARDYGMTPKEAVESIFEEIRAA